MFFYYLRLRKTKQKAFVPFALRSGRLLREVLINGGHQSRRQTTRRAREGERNTREGERDKGADTHTPTARASERDPPLPRRIRSDLTSPPPPAVGGRRGGGGGDGSCVGARQVQARVPWGPVRRQDQHHHPLHVRQVRQHLPGTTPRLGPSFPAARSIPRVLFVV